jgi:hypothetical protein
MLELLETLPFPVTESELAETIPDSGCKSVGNG